MKKNTFREPELRELAAWVKSLPKYRRVWKKASKYPCLKLKKVYFKVNPAIGREGHAKRIRCYQAAFAAKYKFLPGKPYVISHVCHNKCLTPEHMEAVLQSVNASRTACKLALAKNKKKGAQLICEKHDPPCFIGDA